MTGRYARPPALAFGLSAILMAFSSCPGPGAIPASAYLDSIEIGMPSLAGLPDGAYRGSARIALPQGSIAAYPFAEVEVAVAGGFIAEVRLIEPSSLSRDPDFAAFRARIVAANGVDVDGVSGASFTSAALRLAVAKAVTR